MAGVNPFQAALDLREIHCASEPLPPSATETEIGGIKASPSGIMAALLGIIGLGKVTTLSFTNRRLIKEETAASAVDRTVIPMSKVAFTSYGFSKPIWAIFAGLLMFLSGLIGAAAGPKDAEVGGFVFLAAAVILILYYFIAKRSYYIVVASDGVLGTAIKLKVPSTEEVDRFCEVLVDQVRLNTSVGGPEA